MIFRRRWFSHNVWIIIGVTSLLLLGNLFSGERNLWLYFLVAICLYYVCCLFLNKTDVTLSSDQILVKTHPLPWLDAAPVNVSEVVEFNVRFRKGRTGWFYDLTYTGVDRQEHRLIRFIINQAQADYLCEMLSRHYGLGNKIGDRQN